MARQHVFNRILAGIAGGALVVSGAGGAIAGPSVTPELQPNDSRASIDQAVIDAIEDDGTTEF